MVSPEMEIGRQGIELLYEHFGHRPTVSPFFSDR
jgi:hypothetical protein